MCSYPCGTPSLGGESQATELWKEGSSERGWGRGAAVDGVGLVCVRMGVDVSSCRSGAPDRCRLPVFGGPVIAASMLFSRGLQILMQGCLISPTKSRNRSGRDCAFIRPPISGRTRRARCSRGLHKLGVELKACRVGKSWQGWCTGVRASTHTDVGSLVLWAWLDSPRGWPGPRVPTGPRVCLRHHEVRRRTLRCLHFERFGFGRSGLV